LYGSTVAPKGVVAVDMFSCLNSEVGPITIIGEVKKMLHGCPYIIVYPCCGKRVPDHRSPEVDHPYISPGQVGSMIKPLENAIADTVAEESFQIRADPRNGLPIGPPNTYGSRLTRLLRSPSCRALATTHSLGPTRRRPPWIHPWRLL
jgi:hypothetical protein